MAENNTTVIKKSQNNFDAGVFSGMDMFRDAWKMADALSRSTIIPKEYQGDKGIGNCLIALEMASRMGTSPMMVMQNLYVVNGRPAWSSQYIVAMINSSKKYKTELQYQLEGSGSSLSCYAFVEDYDGRVVSGPVITMEMAKAEGWVDKSMSKWKTMPEVMIRYRAASFFGRLNCPDMIMGIYSSDEVIDMKEARWDTEAQVINANEMIAEEIEDNANQVLIDIDETTGEVTETDISDVVIDGKNIEPKEQMELTSEPAPEPRF